jgi:hypothetical protein
MYDVEKVQFENIEHFSGLATYPKPRLCLGNSGSCMNDLSEFQPAFNGVNTLLAVSTNIETEQITNGNLRLKGNRSF